MRAARDEERWLAWVLWPVAWALMAVVVVVTVAVVLENLGAPLVALVQNGLPAPARPFALWVGEAVRVDHWLLLGLLVAAGMSLFTTVRAARRAHWMGIFAGIFCATAALTSSVSQVILPGIACHQSLRGLMSSARELIGSSGELSFFNAFEYGAVFYWRGHIGSYDGPWPDGAPRYLLVYEDEWKRREPLANGQYERVAFPNDENMGEIGRLVLIRRVGEDKPS